MIRIYPAIILFCCICGFAIQQHNFHSVHGKVDGLCLLMIIASCAGLIIWPSDLDLKRSHLDRTVLTAWIFACIVVGTFEPLLDRHCPGSALAIVVPSSVLLVLIIAAVYKKRIFPWQV